MTNQREIVDRIRKESASQGIKLSFLIDLCAPGGYNPSYLSEIARGKRRLAEDVLTHFAEVLRVPVEYLKGETTDREQKEKPAAKSDELEGVYLSLAKEAQANGLDPEDIRKAIELVKQIRGENL